jgi:hypothetical protein
VTVEFHDYWYPDLAERTSRSKERLCDLGFHMIRFTPNNKDVLFVNRQEVKISDSEWLFLKNVTRNVNFGGRALRAAARRILRLDKAA